MPNSNLLKWPSCPALTNAELQFPELAHDKARGPKKSSKLEVRKHHLRFRQRNIAPKMANKHSHDALFPKIGNVSDRESEKTQKTERLHRRKFDKNLSAQQLAPFSKVSDGQWDMQLDKSLPSSVPVHDEPHRAMHSSTQILKTSAPIGHSSVQLAKEPPGQPDGFGLGFGLLWARDPT